MTFAAVTPNASSGLGIIPDTNKWEAPSDPRQHYGLSRALYKVYFTSNVLANEDAAEDNVAAEFAELMLPEIDKALFPEANTGAAAGDAAEAAADDEAESSATADSCRSRPRNLPRPPPRSSW